MLAGRRIGASEARRLAACGSLGQAVGVLEPTTYRVTPAGKTIAAATPAGLAVVQYAISAGLIWDLRVLAGWLPRGGLQLMRVLAGWFEIANVAELLAELDGRGRGSYFELGLLATAWSRARHARSLAQLRSTLAASAWRDPGGESAADIAVGLRARWAERVAALGEPARSWAAGALALLLAAQHFGEGRTDHKVLESVAISLLGSAAAGAGTIDELASALPARASWVLAPPTSPTDLWRSEALWWRRVENDAHGLLARSGFDSGPVIGTAALLAADVRRVRSALEIAARGGGMVEAFDAVV
jgi:hypothetical protein